VPEALRGDPGGILGLDRLLTEHGEAVEADLAFRGVDLRDLWRPGTHLTWRRLKVLVNNLPQESATQTAIRDSMPADVMREAAVSGHGRWSHEAMLLALLVDCVNAMRYEAVAMQGGAKPTEPKPLPRPGVEPAVRPINEEARAYLARLRRGA
jgi:hypothetical protein